MKLPLVVPLADIMMFLHAGRGQLFKDDAGQKGTEKGTPALCRLYALASQCLNLVCNLPNLGRVLV
jgi:hypothetical protein